MLTFGRAFGLVVPIIALGALEACSPGTKGAPSLDPNESGGASAAGATGGASGGAGMPTLITGGASGNGGTGGGIATGGGSGMSGSNSGTGGTDIQECAGSVEMGMPIPVDVYVMLDISGSMLDAGGTDSTTTKWDSVKAALGAFFGDAQSAGLSVAIQYFPLPVPGVPTSCTTNQEGGGGGPCFLNLSKLN